MKRAKKRAFTLIEMMFTVAFLFVVACVVADAMVETSRIQNVTAAQYDMQRQSHHELDVFTNDIHDSQLVLNSYTYNAVTYNSDLSTTVVLQAPSYDSTGSPLGTNDIIIYYLKGTAAPYSMYRIVVPASGSARKAVSNELIVENVNSMALTYWGDDDIIGDSKTTTFTLYGTPSDTPFVMINGTTEIAGAGQFTFTAPQTVTFTNAPNAPDALDIIYTIDPSVSPSYISSINVDLKLQQKSAAFQDAAKTQTVEIASRTQLRNH